MASPLTSRERIGRMYEHRAADRVPIYETPWKATVERWQREGMPADESWVDFFGLDRIVGVGVDNSPRYETRTLEETEDYIIATTKWGATMKNWKHQASTPDFLDFTIKTPDDWRAAKARMTPSPDRIPWDHLKANYPRWREQGAWVAAHGWFGFDVTHAWTVGTERLLMAMAADPEWCADMFNHFLDVNLALLEQVMAQGFEFDEFHWPDDMGYKHRTFFSLQTYRDLLKPVQARAIAWAHRHGMKARLHSCGNITAFIPDLLDIGLDALNPLEVKAGVDPLALKRQYGERLLLHGGIDALIWRDVEAMAENVRRVMPAMMRGGGYIFGTDHSTPSSVSLADFRRIVDLVKEVGRY